jgi:hypothetical protein
MSWRYKSVCNVRSFGKFLKFYIEFNCLDHEHIAQGFQVGLARSRNPVLSKTVTVPSFMAAETRIRQLTPGLSRPNRSDHVNGMPTRRYL